RPHQWDRPDRSARTPYPLILKRSEPAMQLALVHARYQMLETLRIPIAVVGSAFFPAASMLFFVVPFAGDQPVAATYATASMVTFAVMTNNLFQYGIGVAEDRAHPWDPFTRTLPAGAGPRFAGR